ncbi:hypothetical protein LTR66_007939 [Elasticomyces elasticus]|nr:hypothetical protein LTR66_007939 [Elasticomyces elasticus]
MAALPPWYRPLEKPYITHVRGEGWVQGLRELDVPGGGVIRNFDRHLPRFRPNYYWVRHNDGKSPGFKGRMKDVFTNRGPGVGIAINGDRRLFWQDVPSRSNAFNWPEFEDPEDGPRNEWLVPRKWPFRKGNLPDWSQYDHRTRRYHRKNNYSWSDAIWDRPGDRMPRAHADAWGTWHQHIWGPRGGPRW